MNKKEIPIPFETSSLIERLQYEYNARRDVVVFMVQNEMDITSDNFKAYEKEMVEKKVEFETAKSELFKIYLKPLGCCGKTHWTIIFDSNVVEVGSCEHKK